jgi:ribosomal protein S27E
MDVPRFNLERLAGALLHTRCPNCLLDTGALINNTDDRWMEVECPGCSHTWTEEL